MLMRVPCQRIEVTLARMVIPRSRSRSLESSARSTRRWLSRTAPDCCSSRSTKVVLPWSTWAMIATLRRFMGCIKNRSRASKGPLLPGNIVSAPRGAMRDQLARFLSLCGPAPLRRGTGKATMVGERGGGRVRSSVPVKNRRRILCVFPHYTPAFGTFNHAYRLMKGVRAFMPPQGLLLIGELGDATDQLIARLDASVSRPPAQLRLETKERLPLQDFPIPAYDLIPLKNYLMLTLQFSSGCPYLCEFCDIPNLYGRQPRLKTPAQVTAELDAMRKQKGHPPVVYFVDDNFIGNRKAAKDMLPHLLAWQKQHGYPLQFACEATLNIAKQPDILRLMRECSFLGLFVGIETPAADALKAMRKNQNVAVPMMESIKTLNDYGLEVTYGIILGLDTDSDDTESRLKDFIDVSQIPMLTINLLQALPKTPLWDRRSEEHT